ncbi:JAB1/Mov34/MPN/PAD-1 ubiquitin protease-domain-containing protein [Naematelia encephala]|uniref:COP9 signalosome complex subunit 5 n=1 Tax=Naematelia encephala TaxID=71784 RepID=A0A1Y2AGA2_9TREE|nr:JAB1/Mov34/MPN/PAD-1 ubiquitin protease-domain-containing protein [Naematelia encephala]
MDAGTARKTFELHNDVKFVDPTDELYRYTRKEEREFDLSAPWKVDYEYFHTVKISAVALIKMVTHARSGGIYEIMGVMYGKVRDHTFWITDAAALPVQGTETRVNAGNEASEYMVSFQTANGEAGKNELLRGWYHSHPGYGCWLSGIDVNTQLNNQKFNDPYLAVVIDPNRTVSAGKVEIGAFRTYPEGYTPPSSTASQYQSIPMDKIEDFGVHANAYYPLKVEIYKTKLDEQLLDLLWNKYWVATLSQSLIVSNRPYATSQMNDLATKLNSARGSLSSNTAHLKARKEDPLVDRFSSSRREQGLVVGVDDEETPLSKAAKDSGRIASQVQNGIISQIIKDRLFNTPLDSSLDPALARAAVEGKL